MSAPRRAMLMLCMASMSIGTVSAQGSEPDAEPLGMAFLLIPIVLGSLPILAFLYSAIVSGFIQQRNLDALLVREKAFVQRMGRDTLSNLRAPTDARPVMRSQLLHESLVVGVSWWQMLMGGIMSLFGGQIQAFEQVVSYARQEAQQRLREQAERQGFEEVINLRIETSIMSSRQQQRSSSVEILAFGTGIVYGSESSPE